MNTREEVKRLVRIRIRSGKEEDALLQTRVLLKRDIEAWRKRQNILLPALFGQVGIDQTFDLSRPETAVLHLPSSFTTLEQCETIGIKALANVEHSMRHGQAYDALQDLRFTIQTYNANLDFKKKSVRGQGPNTRAEDFLRTLKAQQRAFAQTYNRARKARLCLEEVWQDLKAETDQDLLEILDSELWGKDTSRAAGSGDTATEEPWFWCVGGKRGKREGKASWSTDSECL